MNYNAVNFSKNNGVSSVTELLKDQSTFQAIAETLPLAIYLSIGEEQIGKYLNPAFTNLFGYTLDEVPTIEQWWPLAYPDPNYRKLIRAEWNKRVHRAIERQSAIEPIETVVTCKDASKKFIRWGYITIGDKNYAYGLDLTDNRHSEQVLKESEERFHALFEQAPLGYQSLDENGRFMEVNQAWLEMLGYRRDEVIGKWIGDFLTPDCQEAFKERFAAFKASGRTHAEFQMLHKDGTPRIIDIEGRIGCQPNGAFKQTHCILADITERKRAEQALLEREAEFRSTLHDLMVGVVVHAPDSSILLSNPQAHQILGLSEEQMAGKKAVDPCWRFVAEDLTPLRVEDYPVSRVISTGEKISNQILGISHPDRNEPTWVLLSAAPVFSNDHILNRIVVNFLDITKRKQEEEEKIRLQEQLFQAKKMETVGQLAGGVAHDFNNILQSILGHAELAPGMLSPDDPVQGDLKEIRRAARHAADLIRQLLAFARKQEKTPLTLNLNASVENILNILHPLVGETIELIWEPTNNLWPVTMDPTQINQMLINLCVNARDAINGAGGRVTIALENIRIAAPQRSYGDKIIPGDYVLLSVSDTGCGMNGNTKEHLFEPFFTTKEVGKGTGLGLSMVYGIARQNGGYIDIISDPGQGTTFRIYLPRGENGDASPETPKPFA